MDALGFGVIALIVAVVLIFSMIVFMASRYKRCPSDKVLVIYGRVEKGRSSKTMHGGGTCRKRMHFAADITGAEIMRTIRDEVRNRPEQIQVAPQEVSEAIEYAMYLRDRFTILELNRMLDLTARL